MFQDKTPPYSPARADRSAPSRLADFPRPYHPPSGIAHVASAVRLPSVELDIHRSTFKVQHGDAVLDRTSVATRAQLHQQREQLISANRGTSFVLGPETAGGVRLDPDVARQQQRIQVQSPAFNQPTNSHQQAADSSKFKQCATESSVYVAGGDPREQWSTVQRSSYNGGGGTTSAVKGVFPATVPPRRAASALGHSSSAHANDHGEEPLSDAQKRAAVRDAQRQAHVVFASPTPWQSESRGCFQNPTIAATSASSSSGDTGAPPLNRREAKRQQSESHLQIGFANVDVKDTLRSLKQVDYAWRPSSVLGRNLGNRESPQSIKPPAAATVSVVFGYDGSAGPQHQPTLPPHQQQQQKRLNGAGTPSPLIASTYGTSFTPVAFRQ